MPNTAWTITILNRFSVSDPLDVVRLAFDEDAVSEGAELELDTWSGRHGLPGLPATFFNSFVAILLPFATGTLSRVLLG